MYDGEVDRLQDTVEEGKIYSFTQIDIKGAPTQYKLVDSDIECVFTKETEIEEQDEDNSIPMFSFKLRTFDKVHAFEGNKRLLIDVMAMVREVGPVYYKQSGDKQIPKRDILLVDKTILEQLRNKEIASCNIGGANMVAVNLTGATRITVQELKGFSTFNSNMCGFYEVVITISKIYYDEHNRLWYTGCGWCRTGLLGAPNTQYWCRKCDKYYFEVHLRYVFKMEIVDHTGSHDVTIFDEVGEKLLGCKANSLSELFKKVSFFPCSK
ncbi:Replication protein A DNA-binding subunit B [Carex littledalei]|uniref:Replication protein A DNA-binding subunit B n=1 Tax=Carex littledalei TaxID=544730 RepID=A0A833RC97_9POAL|nr:Replication protein A DNA-binding subunit B [Carex littledalei]